MYIAIAMVLVMASLPTLAAQADSPVTLSGRVYNATTGVGYAGVTLGLCGPADVTTNANGNWQATVASGTGYCVRVAGGAPAGVSGPATRNNPAVGAATSYEAQLAGVTCAQTTCNADQQRWDRAVDGGLDFIYTNGAPAVATPAATPVPTPAPSTGAPATPSDFTAQTGPGGQRLVSLAWKGADDPATVTSYKLERSIDNATWTAIGGTLTGTSYNDTDVLPDVHYYYRLSALGATGQASGYAITDLSTGNVLSAQTTAAPPSYTSDDKLATVTLSDGLPDGATCTLSTADRPQSGSDTAIAGTYTLTCHDGTGAGLTNFKPTLTWKFSLKKPLQGYVSPQVVKVDSDGHTTILNGANYDQQAGTLKITAPLDAHLAVMAAQPDRSWITYLVVGGVVLLVLAILAIIPIRTMRKQSYQEYIRSKYYNL